MKKKWQTKWLAIYVDHSMQQSKAVICDTEEQAVNSKPTRFSIVTQAKILMPDYGKPKWIKYGFN